MNGKWLTEKLSQNGFDLQDLADQTGLDITMLKRVADNQLADQGVWNIILDTLNSYPAIRTPSEDILQYLASDISQYGEDASCQVYYGVNQNLLGFCGYRCLEDLAYHGANVDLTYLADMTLPLSQAQELFKKQNYTLQTYTATQTEGL